MATSPSAARFEEAVAIDTPAGQIAGIMAVPPEAQGAVIFAQGTGSGLIRRQALPVAARHQAHDDRFRRECPNRPTE